MIPGKFGPGGSPGRGIGGFMFAAIDPQVLLAKCGVHESAMMRLRRIPMREGSEVPAADAHALNGDDAGLLKVPDHGDERNEKLLLVGLIEGASGGFGNAAGSMRGCQRCLSMLGQDDAHRAAITWGRGLVDVSLALQGADGVGGGGLGNAQLLGDVANAQSKRPAFEGSHDSELGRVDAGGTRAHPVIGSKRCRKAFEAFVDAEGQGLGGDGRFHTSMYIGVLYNGKGFFA